MILGWPDGQVIRVPGPWASPEGRVDIEVDGVAAEIDAHEQIEVLARYGMAVPRAFADAARLCRPGEPGTVGHERLMASASRGTGPVWRSAVRRGGGTQDHQPGPPLPGVQAQGLRVRLLRADRGPGQPRAAAATLR
ncbi:hypothetical protein ACWF94_04580 [Streptomyces sp. NPDC055078]